MLYFLIIYVYIYVYIYIYIYLDFHTYHFSLPKYKILYTALLRLCTNLSNFNLYQVVLRIL